MSVLSKSVLLSSVSLCVVGVFNAAQAADSLEAAFKEGKATFETRYRYEFADQANIANDAHAQTLSTRLGYKTGELHGFSLLVEGENITQVGPDNYNDTINNRTDHPTIADVEDTAVNQAYLSYAGIPDTNLKVGRQIIALDNQRFIGPGKWRQNDQTFDAATLFNSSLQDTTLTYNYITGVNRIFGTNSPVGDFDSNSHAVTLTNSSLPIGKVSAYAYLLDFQSSSPANSSDTYGISLVGKQKLNAATTFKYRAEYAQQSDAGDNANNYNADYFHLKPALAWNGWTATLGYESLGSDNGASFRTPLATLHKFNGWADIFLTTPATGLEDLYADITYKFGGEGALSGLSLKGQYHDFSAESGGADYGTEFGLSAYKPIAEKYFVHARYADYDADTFAADTQRFIFGAGFKF